MHVQVLPLSLLVSFLFGAGDVAPRAAHEEGYLEVRPLAGPSFGIIVGRSSGVRVARGVPGSATLGPELAVPKLSAWAVSPDRDYLIGVTETSGRLVMVRDLGSSPQTSALRRWRLDQPVVVLSPSGTAAAVYDPGLKKVTVWNGLPERPVLAWETELMVPSGELTSLTVRDDSRALLTVIRGSLSETVRGQSSRHITSIGDRGQAVYLPASNEFVFSDGSSVMLSDSQDLSLLAGPEDGLTSTGLIASSADGTTVLIGNDDPPGVVIVDRTLRTARAVALPDPPSVLRRLSNGSDYLLSGIDQGAPRILSAGDSPRLTFIPLPAAAKDRSAQ